MQKKNLFLVASPLQFLNAIEAKKHFKTTNNTLVLQYNSSSASQEKDLLDSDEWDEVIIYDTGKIHKNLRFFQHVKLIKYLKKFEYDYVFSGEEGIFARIIFANLSLNSIYLVDDGTAIISTYDKVNPSYYKSLPFSAKTRFYRYLLAGLKYYNKHTINFFTAFNLQKREGTEIIHHNFPYLQSKMQNFKKTDTIYFLGQNLVGTQYLTPTAYIDYLKQFIKTHKEKKILYIPHRSETVTEEYQELLSDNFTIQPSQGPIELVLINQKIYPKTIVSFFSSALFNLNKIFHDSKIMAINIDTTKLPQEKKKLVHDCYAFFNHTTIEIVEL